MTSMTPSTIVELSDVHGNPKVKMILPQVHIGHRIHLHFRLSRQNGGRSEQLLVDGDFRVTSASLDASTGVAHQVITVDSVMTPPSWKAVKKLPPTTRKLGPARAAPIAVS